MKKVFLIISIGLSLFLSNYSICYSSTKKTSVKAPSIKKTINKKKKIKSNISFYYPTGKKTYLGEKCIPGKTAGVSKDLKHLMGKKIYIEGFGVRHVTDLTHDRIKNRIDLAIDKNKNATELGVKKNRMIIVMD